MDSNYSTPTATPSKKRCVRLPDFDLDCAVETCNGFLCVYGYDSTSPVFVKCSNENSPDSFKSCTQKYMFSHQESECIACGLQISMKEIIALNTKQRWVHCECIKEGFSSFFGICLRCNERIDNEEESVPSCIGPSKGYIHLRL
jgi:hypothetical protein